MDVEVQRDRATRSHRALCPECGRAFSIITGNQDRAAPNVERLLRLQVSSHLLSHAELQVSGAERVRRPERPTGLRRLVRLLVREPAARRP